MIQVYDIFLGEESIGTAQVRKVGLYYQIDCLCRLSGQIHYRIIASGNAGEKDLGLCVPTGRQFGLQIRLPIKRIGEKQLCFKAVPKHQELSGKFVPISPEEPFQYIQMLQKSHLITVGTQHGVVLPDQIEISNPTGQ